MSRQRIAVAVSGGRDSTALWHVSARLAAAEGTFDVIGLHVHHGLQTQADSWLLHLRKQASRWAARGLPVSLQWRRLQGTPAAGESTEAWARRERYAALADMAHEHGAELVLLAHHRRDQAETYLLQALRGAGPAGLAAMPRLKRRQDITWARPWLDLPRESVEAYLRRHRLSFVEDLSNADLRWARNRLRHTAWPALSAAFEHAETSLAASARRAQEAAACLRELAGLDQIEACDSNGELIVAAWLGLSPARRANLLRLWLAQWGTRGVPETLVQRLSVELPSARCARWQLGSGELRLYAGRLQFAAAVGDAGATFAHTIAIDLSHPGRVAVPAWHGAFDVCVAHEGGLPAARLLRCELRARRGGERFQRRAGALPRSLKQQFQAAAVPPWLRGGPLVFAGDELLYVPALGVDARQWATAGTPMLSLRWVADRPGALHEADTVRLGTADTTKHYP